jgi:D-alanyl-D-alanine dipeptidase
MHHKQKIVLFPYVDHNTVFEKGFVAKKSGHSRGSTIDLTFIDKNKLLKPVNSTKRV